MRGIHALAIGVVLAAGLLCTATAAARPIGRWGHGDIRHFHEHDWDEWRGGRWDHDWHGGHFGWWWVVGGVWFWYPQPVYPYPYPYAPPPYVPPEVEWAPTPAYWYYCPPAGAYYPYVPACPTGWRRVPATPP